MPDPVDPIALAQAAAMSGAAIGNVRPIRPDLADRKAVKCVSAIDFL